MSSQKQVKEQDDKWLFDNSYTRLSKHLYTRTHPVFVQNPKLIIINHGLAKELDLPLADYSKENLSQLFSGNKLPKKADPIAQAYAGHQFGHFTFLGDGRAHLIGEYVTSDGKRFDIQLKGSGKTPYGVKGDGRAALGPMLREYMISEAMHSLGIKTTRSLAVVTTGETVYRETTLEGAILTRISSSHIRIGTFEYLAAKAYIKELKQLADYVINRHMLALEDSKNKYLDLLNAVMVRQIKLIVDWLRVGFIHGVMNTDNMTISGETIDYGPCAFMDEYNPQTVFSSIDHAGRYAYANQPYIAKWNLMRFAETLLPIIHNDKNKANILVKEIIDSFDNIFNEEWLNMMRNKLGLVDKDKKDKQLIINLLNWMQQNKADYTNTFYDLSYGFLPQHEKYQKYEFKNWYDTWQIRLNKNNNSIKSSLSLMRTNNPVIIPRNHRIEEAISAAEENGEFSETHKLIKALSKPYSNNSEFIKYQQNPSPKERVHHTFCGT